MAAYWPTATGPLAQWMNDTPKVVLSNTAPDTSIWQNSTVATGATGTSPAAWPSCRAREVAGSW
jgi:hypothetical protein